MQHACSLYYSYSFLLQFIRNDPNFVLIYVTCICMFSNVGLLMWPSRCSLMINQKKEEARETDNFYRIKADFCFCWKKWVLSFIGVLYARAHSKVIYNYGCIKISSCNTHSAFALYSRFHIRIVLADRKWWRNRQLNILPCFFLNIQCMAIMRRSLWDRQSLNTFPICKKLLSIIIGDWCIMCVSQRAREKEQKNENEIGGMKQRISIRPRFVFLHFSLFLSINIDCLNFVDSGMWKINMLVAYAFNKMLSDYIG